MINYRASFKSCGIEIADPLDLVEPGLAVRISLRIALSRLCPDPARCSLRKRLPSTMRSSLQQKVPCSGIS